MSMTAAGMASAIETQINNIPGINITSAAELNAFCLAISTAIVGYIQSSGTVTPGSFSNSGGPVTGTGGIS